MGKEVYYVLITISLPAALGIMTNSLRVFSAALFVTATFFFVIKAIEEAADD